MVLHGYVSLSRHITVMHYLKNNHLTKQYAKQAKLQLFILPNLLVCVGYVCLRTAGICCLHVAIDNTNTLDDPQDTNCCFSRYLFVWRYASPLWDPVTRQVNKETREITYQAKPAKLETVVAFLFNISLHLFHRILLELHDTFMLCIL